MCKRRDVVGEVESVATFVFKCKRCGRFHEVSQRLAGKSIKCLVSGKRLRVPKKTESVGSSTATIASASLPATAVFRKKSGTFRLPPDRRPTAVMLAS